MSDKMVALLGFVLGEKWTDPMVAQLHVDRDGVVLVMHEGEIGYNHVVGGAEDLCRNFENLYAAAGLDKEEKSWMRNSLMSWTGLWSPEFIDRVPRGQQERQTRLFERKEGSVA